MINIKTFVIGDVHGCFPELFYLINEFDVDFASDRLIMLGDYIDRGDFVLETVEYVMELKKIYGPEHVVLLRGNHEQMAIDNYKSGRNYWGNGCEKTLKYVENASCNYKEWIEFFETLRLYYEDEYFLYVHAGINPSLPLNKQTSDDLLWIRDGFYNCKTKFNKKIIFGHTPTFYINNGDEPIIMEDKIALDTGCVYGKNLSGLKIIDGEIVSIKSIKKGSADKVVHDDKNR